MALLDGLSEFADKLDKNTVVNKVWPHLVCTPRLGCRVWSIEGVGSKLGLRILSR